MGLVNSSAPFPQLVHLQAPHCSWQVGIHCCKDLELSRLRTENAGAYLRAQKDHTRHALCNFWLFNPLYKLR